MSNNPIDAKALKPALIKLLEDEEMLGLIRRALGIDTAHEDERKRADKNERLALEQQIDQIKNENKQLLDQLNRSEQAEKSTHAELVKKRQECEQLQHEITSLQQRSLLPPDLAGVLSHVRGDAELVKYLALNATQDDSAMLVQTVAVLSQERSLERLWNFYKNRCENKRGELSPQDRTVFEAALGWLNANRPDKPHLISEPAVGAPYDYQKNIRPPGMVGETITAIWLPGVPSMRLLPVVATS